MRSTHRLALVFAAGATLLATAGVAAYACTNLATLMLSSQSGSTGDTVTVTGGSFVSAGDPVAGAPITIHWNGSDGPTVAVAVPDEDGTIAATFVVPEAKPGYYVVTASVPGTGATLGRVARAQYLVVGSPRPSAGVLSAHPSPPVRESRSDRSWALGVFVTLLGTLGVALLAGALVGVVRHASAGLPTAERIGFEPSDQRRARLRGTAGR